MIFTNMFVNVHPGSISYSYYTTRCKKLYLIVTFRLPTANSSGLRSRDVDDERVTICLMKFAVGKRNVANYIQFLRSVISI